LIEFFEGEDNKLLVIYLNAKDEPTISFIFPPSLRKKGVYFLKKVKAVGADDKDLDSVIIHGDLSPSPLEQLSLFIEQIYLPMLTNQHRVDQWPEVLMQDVFTHFHKLHGEVQVSIGKVKVST